MSEKVQQSQRQSPLHGFLSLILPGLGQAVAGYMKRGLSIFLTLALLIFISSWSVAQRARFPDIGLSIRLFAIITAQCFALLVFVTALRYLVRRFVLKDPPPESLMQGLLIVSYIILAIIASPAILGLSGSEADLKTIHNFVAVLAAMGVAALWWWQAKDAANLGGKQAPASIQPGLLIALSVILILGWNITEINIDKAIREYKDTQVILRKIVWPWAAAFEVAVDTVEVTTKIQAPCPEGATGPDVSERLEGEPWISVTPTCGELSVRKLTGEFEPGTDMTITGGGFLPGLIVEVWWKTPIGNPFRPRSGGDTRITIDENGEFESALIIPDVVIPTVAVGDQIHTLIIRQETNEHYTGRLSREMNLALKGIFETILMGLMATFTGIIAAVPFSFLAARNLMSPIVSKLSDFVGGVLLLIPGLWLGGFITTNISSIWGGLDGAPIPTALLALVFTLGFGFAGWRLGTGSFTALAERAPESVSRTITALGLGLIGAGAGYLLGLGFNYGVLSIPLGEEVAAEIKLQVGLAGAVILGLASLYYAFRAGVEREVRLGMLVYSVARTCMNIVRSIEPLIWAVIGIIWIGPGPFAGYIALTLHTIAALGKLYSESIESIDPGPIEALQSTGANRLQTIIFAVVPQILPPFISFTIYRWDINVRMSTIIGVVGGGGIGFILIQWQRLFQYQYVGMAVWLIAITVATLDFVSSNIRERFV